MIILDDTNFRACIEGLLNMNTILKIQNFINSKITEIAKELPALVNADPASFSCGNVVGYKQACLDIDSLIFDAPDTYIGLTDADNIDKINKMAFAIGLAVSTLEIFIREDDGLPLHKINILNDLLEKLTTISNDLFYSKSIL